MQNLAALLAHLPAGMGARHNRFALFCCLRRAHPEPASAVAFSSAGLFTACHGTSARAWARPPLTQAAVIQRIDSLHSMDRAASIDQH